MTLTRHNLGKHWLAVFLALWGVLLAALLYRGLAFAPLRSVPGPPHPQTALVLAARFPAPPAPVGTPTCRPGDFDCDGIIGAADFVILMGAYGTSDDGNPNYNPLCDLIKDHMINGLDFVQFKRLFGT